MSTAEFGRWIAYFNKNGRCGLARMYDVGAALVCWKIDKIMGGSTEIADYLPRVGQSEQQPDASVEEVIKSFGGGVRRR